MHGILSDECVLIVGLGLSQTQAVFGIFDNQQCVAFLHLLVLFKIYFLDEALYAGVDRRDVLFYLCVVGVAHVAEMDEAAAYPADAAKDNH